MERTTKEKWILRGLTFFILVFLVLMLFSAHIAAACLGCGPHTVEGRVTKYTETMRDEGSISYIVAYEYERVDGEQKTGEEAISVVFSPRNIDKEPAYSIGEIISIRYNPDKDFSIIVDEAQEQDSLFLTLLFTVLFFITLIFRIRYSQNCKKKAAVNHVN
jgi:hypothetical protein